MTPWPYTLTNIFKNMFFAGLKSSALHSQYLQPLQINLWYADQPAKMCPWSLPMKGDHVQLLGRLPVPAINLSMPILETRDLKLNILQQIGLVKL